MMIIFAILGYFTVTLAVYGITHMIIVLVSKCDSETAFAPNLPTSYSGKVCWITGASSGLGKEMALQLAAKGAKLILSSRREQILKDVVKECRSINPSCDVSILVLDLENVESLAEKTARAVAVYGRVDVLINNGGVAARSPAIQSSIAVDVTLLKVNYLSAVAITRALLPVMETNGGGSIVNIASVCSKLGIPLMSSYSGSKHALLGWFDAFRAEERLETEERTVVITNVILGKTKTEIAKNAIVKEGSRNRAGAIQNEMSMSTEFVAERVLRAAHGKIGEVWIAPPMELAALYINYYFPSVAKYLVYRKFSKSD